MRAIYLVRLAIAGTLVTGCTVNITNPLITGNNLVTTQGSPKPIASTPPSQKPVVTPGGGTVIPPHNDPMPCTAVMQTLELSGKVYDADGRSIERAKLRIVSLDSERPYDSTIDVLGGQYKLNLWPQGQEFALTVTADGFAPRTRKVTLPKVSTCGDSSTLQRVFHFGGPKTEDDPVGATLGLTVEMAAPHVIEASIAPVVEASVMPVVH